MAQEKVFIAVRSDQLSRPGEARYVIKNRETHEVVDDNSGRGYKSPTSAHASFAFKQKRWTPKKPVVAGTAKPASPTPHRKRQDASPSLFDTQK